MDIHKTDYTCAGEVSNFELDNDNIEGCNNCKYLGVVIEK